MPFVTVPEDRLLTDIMKTWLTYFSGEASLADVNFIPAYPDVDEEFKIPAVVLRRVAPEEVSLSRIAGYHGAYTPDEANKIGRLEGFTYMCTYQFDVLTRSVGELNRFSSLILQKLKHGSLASDVFASVANVRQTVIPLKDFASPTSASGTVTDLKIRFRPWRDVQVVEVPTFDPELHQSSISVDFWVDYLKPRDVDEIVAITQEAEIAVPE